MRSAIEATATQTGAAMDIDLSIFAFKGGNFVEKIYFGDRNSNDGSINLSEDNRTGKGDGDDEKAILDALRCTYDRLFFTVNIYRARENNQHFGQVANAYICVRDPKKPVDKPESELVRYNLSEDYNGKSSIICAEARLNDGNIEFIAIGEGSNDGSLADVERRLIQRVRQSA
jgi:stress response protein SCP2